MQKVAIIGAGITGLTTAYELKEKGIFEETLRKIYERGQQIDWKVAEINL